MDDCNEKSTPTIQASFEDESGNPTVPTAATYRIDDRTGVSVVIRASGNLPSLASVVDIPILTAETAILNSAHRSELRVLTVEFDYLKTDGSAGHGTNEYKFLVRNLGGVI